MSGGFSAVVNGKAFGSVRPVKCSNAPNGCQTPGYVTLPPLGVYVDGAVVEVYWNGEVFSMALDAANSTDAWLEVDGAGLATGAAAAAVLFDVDVWPMATAVH